jgi:hypothetical protein
MCPASILVRAERSFLMIVAIGKDNDCTHSKLLSSLHDIVLATI